MRSWDSSAVVPLLVSEADSTSMRRLDEADSTMVVWWATQVECTSAIARRQRLGQLPEEVVAEAFRRLRALRAAWQEIEPAEQVRESANRFVRVHELCSADALQLGAAFVAAETRPATLEPVSLDERLQAAARREGFVLTVPG